MGGDFFKLAQTFFIGTASFDLSPTCQNVSQAVESESEDAFLFVTPMFRLNIGSASDHCLGFWDGRDSGVCKTRSTFSEIQFRTL